MFSSAGETATLPCASVFSHDSNCSSTTWVSGRKGKTTVEKVTLGKVIPENTVRAKRLRLLPNCSLHITNVTTDDTGFYVCKQYLAGGSPGEPASVELYVLTSKCCKSETATATEHWWLI